MRPPRQSSFITLALLGVLHFFRGVSGDSDFTVGKMLGDATIGCFGGLAVFHRALPDAKMKLRHDAANLAALP